MRNVVLFCLDSARRDVFERSATRLSARADVTFTQCRAASSWSAPSHASMFTGDLPHRHGVHVHDPHFDSIPRSETFLGEMPDHEALGISANVFASPAYGFDTWFDRFVEVSTGRRFTGGIDPNAFYVESDATGLARHAAFVRAALTSDHPLQSLANGTLATINVLSRDAPIPKLLDDGANTVAREARRLTEAATEPYFLFTNLEDTHMPHRPVWAYDGDSYDAPADFSTDDAGVWEVIDDVEGHREYLEHFRDLYAASTAYVDRTLDSLIDSLQAHSDRETTFLITGDHGENLGTPEDENLLGHKSSLSEGVLHVPLVVVNPPEGFDSTVEEYVSHLDLPTLVAGLARGETPDITRERVPAEILGMSPGPDPPEDYDADYWDRAMRCVYEDETKWVWDSEGGRERVDIDRDRPCWQSVAEADATLPEWIDDYFENEVTTAKDAAMAAETAADVDAATEQRLEDLGYM
ncbi:sulfatase-like hydrolase/transferase [Halapricum sp. CBA1109]|uniref:sulfatase-like hydrolase/transferase n=1 Tax=Halapricum sp. CBA1109 TaxID=2668068 RepID=UPI0012F7DFB8|nr:sulfatase-like hydrolase/transferase [Halapricum sp. CBA1109]MUV88884.1 sulfatase-like hydrolase/transferase [Halapricum sp. CBA1109]